MEQNGMPAEALTEDVLFENVHTRGKAFYREFYINAFVRKPSFFIFTGFGVLYLLAAILTAVFDVADSFWFGFVFLPLFWAMTAFFCWINIRTVSARERESLDGKEPRFVTQITADMLVCTTPLGGELQMELSKIKRVRQTKHYLLLQTPTRQMFPLAKDGFTKGTCEELCAFLRAKNINV